jgi:hypothetical protein
MKIELGIMGLKEQLKIRNLSNQKAEEICFIMVRGGTHIGREITEEVLQQGKLTLPTSLGEVSIVLSEKRFHQKHEDRLWVPGDIAGQWTLWEYFRILKELVEKHQFSCPGGETGLVFQLNSQSFEKWESEGFLNAGN